jgi:hypothetical protein
MYLSSHMLCPQSFMSIFSYLLVETMDTSRKCCHQVGEMLNLTAKAGLRQGSNSLSFELCRRTQQPSFTFRLVGGSTFGLWPLFHLRERGKWTEMTATQHGGTLRH